MWKLKEMHHPNPFPDNEQIGYLDPRGRNIEGAVKCRLGNKTGFAKPYVSGSK
jgi:hypothetical protein